MNERFKLLRKTLALSQEEFGKRLGLTGAAISRIESGTRNITEQVLQSVFAVFKVSESWLRDGQGSMFVDTRSEIDALCKKYNFDNITRAVLESYIDLPEQYRAAISTFLVSIVARIHNYPSSLFDSSMVGKDTNALMPDQNDILSDIDAEVESYRQALLREKKAADESSASPDTAASDA